jgi:hypothetical protein
MITARQVWRIVAHPRAGGARHIDELASLLRVQPGEYGRLWGAVKQAQRAGAVDIWHGYVMNIWGLTSRTTEKTPGPAAGRGRADRRGEIPADTEIIT